MLLRRHHKKEDSQLSEKVVESVFELPNMTVKELKELAKEKGIEGYSTLDKEVLIKALTEKE